MILLCKIISVERNLLLELPVSSLPYQHLHNIKHLLVLMQQCLDPALEGT